MSENPYKSPSAPVSPRTGWYRRPYIFLILAVLLYGVATLLANGARLAYGAGDFHEYEDRVSPSVHLIVKTATVAVLGASVLSLVAATVLALRQLRERRAAGSPHDPHP